MRYMLIFEDGNIHGADELEEGILDSYEDGLVDIIDCETQTVYVGDNTWSRPAPV